MADAECWVCCEGVDSPNGAPSPTGCACRGSAGFAHLPCLVAAARNQLGPQPAEYWHTCPTCKQGYTGATLLGLARAHWELVRRLYGDELRYHAASMLGNALQQTGDLASARPVLEEVVAGMRRLYEDEHERTLHSIGNLALVMRGMRDLVPAAKLAEEAVLAWRRTLGPERKQTLRAMSHYGTTLIAMEDLGSARPMIEEALEGQRALNEQVPNELLNLGSYVQRVGDVSRGLALMEEAVEDCRRVLGDGHPKTQHYVQGLAATRLQVRKHGHSATTCRFATLVGLVRRPELNGSPPALNATVLGFNT